jgi:hypothetical protein
MFEVGKYYLVEWFEYKCIIQVYFVGRFKVIADECIECKSEDIIYKITSNIHKIKEIPKHELPIYIMELMK